MSELDRIEARLDADRRIDPYGMCLDMAPLLAVARAVEKRSQEQGRCLLCGTIPRLHYGHCPMAALDRGGEADDAAVR